MVAEDALAGVKKRLQPKMYPSKSVSETHNMGVCNGVGHAFQLLSRSTSGTGRRARGDGVSGGKHQRRLIVGPVGKMEISALDQSVCTDGFLAAAAAVCFTVRHELEAPRAAHGLFCGAAVDTAESGNTRK